MNRNGIDVDLFHGWAEQVRQEPAAGVASATVRHRWDRGFAVDSRGESFEEAGQTYPRTHHSMRTDWPPPFGSDSGPTPGAELLLCAVGACVATTYVAKAASQGVVLDELEVITSGCVDLQGLLELNGVNAAFSTIGVTIRVRSEADEAVLTKLAETASRTSPSYQSLATPVAIHYSVQSWNAVPEGAVS